MGTERLNPLNHGEKWASEVHSSPKSHLVTGAGKAIRRWKQSVCQQKQENGTAAPKEAGVRDYATLERDLGAF